jgi:hypothetical protein
MENIYDYLRWRGDLSFENSTFLEVDSLILTLISYVNFDGIVPGVDSEDSITIKEASELYWKNRKENSSRHKSFLMRTPDLLREAANTIRFAKIRIGKYVNYVDTKRQIQFAAMTFLLEDDCAFIAFRGTDHTILGWKEDFNMGFMPEVPAQYEAVNYLENTYNGAYKQIRTGGHSKGGNLAIYASIKCKKRIRDNITEVYNFDGPGFTKELIISEQFKEMLPRIKNYIPQASVVGIIMEHGGQTNIIESSQSGMMQHDAFSWGVIGPAFSYIKELDKRSIILDGIMKEWIFKMETEQREGFVNAIFGILDQTGIETTSDLLRIRGDKLISFIKSINSKPEEQKKALSKSIKMFISESNTAIRKELKQKSIKKFTSLGSAPQL